MNAALLMKYFVGCLAYSARVLQVPESSSGQVKLLLKSGQVKLSSGQVELLHTLGFAYKVMGLVRKILVFYKKTLSKWSVPDFSIYIFEGKAIKIC